MKRKITPLLLIAAIIIFIFSIIGCPGKKQITISKNPQPTKALETICPSASLIATITPKPTKLVENTLTPKPTYPIEVTAVPTEEPTKTPKPTNPPVFRVGYSFSETSKLKNVSFTVESFFDGAGTYDEYQVYRTENKIKIQINGDPDVLGTVQYLVPCLKEDGNKYSHLKFYYSRPGADTGYDGSDLKSPYEIWKKKDVTKLLNGGKAKQVSTTSIDGNSVVIYSITEGNKVHRVYYSKKYKVWLKYEIYIDNKLDEKWTIKKFSVGKVTDAQADYKTKLPGHPEQEGYALINISEMIK